MSMGRRTGCGHGQGQGKGNGPGWAFGRGLGRGPGLGGARGCARDSALGTPPQPSSEPDVMPAAAGASAERAANRPALAARSPFRMAVVDRARCTGCGLCTDFCPGGAICVNGAAAVNPALCTGCGICVRACPSGALSLGFPPAGGHRKFELPNARRARVSRTGERGQGRGRRGVVTVILAAEDARKANARRPGKPLPG
jgi:ferredoxin